MICMDGMIRWNDTGSRTGMIRHENLGLVELVNKNATVGRVHEPNRTVLDPGRITNALQRSIPGSSGNRFAVSSDSLLGGSKPTEKDSDRS